MSKKLATFHVVIARFSDGSLFVPEQYEGATRASIIDDIRTGQYTDVEAVFLILPQTGSAINETESIMQDVLARHLNDNGVVPDWIRGMLEHHLGCRAVAEAERSLAA